MKIHMDTLTCCRLRLEYQHLMILWKVGLVSTDLLISYHNHYQNSTKREYFDLLVKLIITINLFTRKKEKEENKNWRTFQTGDTVKGFDVNFVQRNCMSLCWYYSTLDHINNRYQTFLLLVYCSVLYFYLRICFVEI